MKNGKSITIGITGCNMKKNQKKERKQDTFEDQKS